jgi:hypothetical protein
MNNIKTWQERGNWPEDFAPGYDGMPAWEAAKAEIAELRAALASQASKGAGVPDDWEIHRIGKTIRVNHPAVGRVFLPHDCSEPSEVVLYHLAESLLAAAPSPAQAQPVADTVALPILPGCLADRLYEAISIAHNRAEHAGSTPRMRKWDATREDLRKALAAQPPADAAKGNWPKDFRDVIAGAEKAAHELGRAAGIEEAAKVCENEIDPTRSCSCSAYSYWHAKAIRALAAKPAQ